MAALPNGFHTNGFNPNHDFTNQQQRLPFEANTGLYAELSGRFAAPLEPRDFERVRDFLNTNLNASVRAETLGGIFMISLYPISYQSQATAPQPAFVSARLETRDYERLEEFLRRYPVPIPGVRDHGGLQLVTLTAHAHHSPPTTSFSQDWTSWSMNQNDPTTFMPGVQGSLTNQSNDVGDVNMPFGMDGGTTRHRASASKSGPPRDVAAIVVTPISDPSSSASTESEQGQTGVEHSSDSQGLPPGRKPCEFCGEVRSSRPEYIRRHQRKTCKKLPVVGLVAFLLKLNQKYESGQARTHRWETRDLASAAHCRLEKARAEQIRKRCKQLDMPITDTDKLVSDLASWRREMIITHSVLGVGHDTKSCRPQPDPIASFIGNKSSCMPKKLQTALNNHRVQRRRTATSGSDVQALQPPQQHTLPTVGRDDYLVNRRDIIERLNFGSDVYSPPLTEEDAIDASNDNRGPPSLKDGHEKSSMRAS